MHSELYRITGTLAESKFERKCGCGDFFSTDESRLKDGRERLELALGLI